MEIIGGDDEGASIGLALGHRIEAGTLLRVVAVATTAQAAGLFVVTGKGGICMWWLRWTIARWLIWAAFEIMPRSQQRDTYAEAMNSVRVDQKYWNGK